MWSEIEFDFDIFKIFIDIFQKEILAKIISQIDFMVLHSILSMMYDDR
jgi:hypothetical protein